MAARNMIPWGRSSGGAPAGRESRDPLLSLHREMDRIFDEFFRGYSPLSNRSFGGEWPNLDVAERNGDIVVTAELPGLSEKDIDLSLAENVLTIRGERKSETEDSERHWSERFYGRFERRIPLGVEIDEEKVTAAYKDGVLTVTLPKSADAERKARRIPINGKK